MHIFFTPQRRDDSLVVHKDGDILLINGETFDFSVIPDGARLPGEDVDSDFIFGPVERKAGELHLTLILPHGQNPSDAVAFPAPLIAPPDGLLALPFDAPPDQSTEEPAE